MLNNVNCTLPIHVRQYLISKCVGSMSPPLSPVNASRLMGFILSQDSAHLVTHTINKACCTSLTNHMDDINNELRVNKVEESSLGPTVSDAKRRELTPANRLFLQAILDGKPTLEAYKQAGYKGSNHAAYELRSYLKDELIRMLESSGIDRAGLMLSLAQLMQLPLREQDITLKHKLDLLKLLAKTLPASNEGNKPQITAFVVNTRIEAPKGTSSTDTTITEA